MKVVDIAIVGGGAVGLSLLHALKDIAPNVILLESRSENTPNATDRAIGLSLSSQKFLNHLNVWQQLLPFASPINNVQVTVQGHYGSSELKAKEQGLPALGYVIALHQLEDILTKSLPNDLKSKIQYSATLIDCKRQENDWELVYQHAERKVKLKTKWLIGVDGAQSFVRQANKIGLIQREYPHYALVGTIQTDDHKGQAFERFTKEGAIAFLPFGRNKSAFIWTLPSYIAKSYFNIDGVALAKALQMEFGFRLGRLGNIYSKALFPLKMTKADSQTKEGLLLMGSAALNLHPIAAQGLNLSLRAVACLQKTMQRNPLENMEIVSQQYLAGIEPDQKQIEWLTEVLARYVAGGPFPISLRAMGLNLFDMLSPLRSSFTQLSMGFI